MKTKILPTLKEKKRYMSFDVISESKITSNSIISALNSNFKDFLGQIDLGKAGINILNVENNKGILRLNRKYADKIKSSLLFIKSINSKKVIVKSNKMSGILKRVKGGN